VRDARFAACPGARPAGLASARILRSFPAMKDLIFVAVTVGFFALTWLYVKAAARL
jgi:hypothetical protein